MRLYLFKYSKILSVALIVFIFLIIVFFGAGINMSNAQGDMPNCSFMGSIASVCKMNIFEHLGGWQQLFTVILSMVVGLGLLLRNIIRLDVYDFWINKFFVKEDYISKIFNYLTNAFSNGILHPRIY